MSNAAGQAGSKAARKPAALILRVLQSIAAIVVGYLMLILLSTLVQEDLLGGVSYRESSVAALAVAAALTPLCGVGAGFATAAVARCRPVLHVLPMALAIATETTALYLTGRVDGPLWFESLAGGTLIAGTILGAWCWDRLRH